MKEFLSGLITAGDGNASMAKTMTWIVFVVALAGKASFNLGGRGDASRWGGDAMIRIKNCREGRPRWKRSGPR